MARAEGDPNEGGPVPEAVPGAFAVAWLNRAHYRERDTGGCDVCWQDLPDAAAGFGGA